MEEKNDYLNELNYDINLKSSKRFKIATIVLTLIILVLLIVVIVLAAKKQKTTTEENENNNKENETNNEENDEKKEEDISRSVLEKAGYIEPWNDLYGYTYINKTYAKNNKIVNSFKINGTNYNESMGIINNGNDYKKNERNIYDLYIPYSTDYTKNKHNGIMLFIHGGAWIGGTKEDIGHLSSRYAKYGYITATMGYTLLNGLYANSNIFRILDEITACIQDIKDELKSLGFDEDKLEIALGGMSAGAHLALLYSYSIKTSPIPIKFVINIVGPISLEPKYWYKIGYLDQPLDNILPDDIENAFKENKLKKIYENESTYLELMNVFLGNKYNILELLNMIEFGHIKTDSIKYQEMLNAVKYAFPVNFIDSNTVPTLCEYGGKDSIVGIVKYQYLYKLFESNGIQDRIKLIYMKNAEHLLIDYVTQNGIKGMKDMNYQILNYSRTYFTNDP